MPDPDAQHCLNSLVLHCCRIFSVIYIQVYIGVYIVATTSVGDSDPVGLGSFCWIFLHQIRIRVWIWLLKSIFNIYIYKTTFNHTSKKCSFLWNKKYVQKEVLKNYRYIPENRIRNRTADLIRSDSDMDQHGSDKPTMTEKNGEHFRAKTLLLQ